MSAIDFTMAVSLTERLAQEADLRRAKARAECHRRIVEVASETHQLNLAAAAGAGVFTPSQQSAYVEGVTWIAAMRATWENLAANEADIHDDSNWPVVPATVVDLVANT